MGRTLTPTEQDRRRRDRVAHTLHDCMVSKGMQERYRRSVLEFLAFAFEFGYRVTMWENLDEITAEWIEFLYHDGQHKSLASDGLAGLQYFLPQAVGRLKHSWKLTKVWQKLEPPRRVLPLSPLLALGFAGAAKASGFLHEAAGILIGFDAMLRSGEIYRLKVQDVTFYAQRAVLALGRAKMGKRTNSSEMVVVESQVAVDILKQACASRLRSEFLLQRGERVFRTLFNTLLELFEVEGLMTVYSLRRGGASWDFLQHASMERTLLRGRWASTSSARIYVHDAVAIVSHLHLSPTTVSLAETAAQFLQP